MIMVQSQGYIYGGKPEEEARRLSKQAAFFVEHDLPVLQRLGLSKGMNVLDVGCGAGTVTLEIASFVFPGKVIGIDKDRALVEEAKKTALSIRDVNVQFVSNDIVSPGITAASFDFVYCRFVLWAIPERERALQNMIRLARPGGIVCAQEPDAQGAIYWPDVPALHRYWNGRIEYHIDKADGIDPNLGRKLYALFSKAGLMDIKVGVSALYKENFVWQASAKNYIGPGAEAVKEGYISEQVLRERAKWASDPLSFMMFPTIIVAGLKL